MPLGFRCNSSWSAGLGTVLCSAAAFVAGMWWAAPEEASWRTWGAIADVCVLAAVLGSLNLTIAVFDRRSAMAEADRPGQRVALCGAFGALAVLLVQLCPDQVFDAPWVFAGAAVGAVLGWSGWFWLRYMIWR